MLTSYTFSCVHLFSVLPCTSLSWGVHILSFLPLSVCSPPSNARLTFIFYFYLCCIYLRSSYGHNRAVITVERGLRAVMMFAKTPPDEEQ